MQLLDGVWAWWRVRRSALVCELHELAKIVSKVGIIIHPDPPMVHTVHIEPLTPADWESNVF